MSSWLTTATNELLTEASLEHMLEELPEHERHETFSEVYTAIFLGRGRARRRLRERLLEALDTDPFREQLVETLSKLPAVIERVAEYITQAGPERELALWVGGGVSWVCAVPRRLAHRQYEKHVVRSLIDCSALADLGSMADHFLRDKAALAEGQFFADRTGRPLYPCPRGAMVGVNEQTSWHALGHGTYFYAYDLAAPTTATWTHEQLEAIGANAAGDLRKLRKRMARFSEGNWHTVVNALWNRKWKGARG